MKKQKIVIQMQLSRDKDRSKAMQITSLTKGVSSVAIKGDGKDQAEVIGEQIDSVELTKSIRRKVSKYASVQSVEEVKPKEEEKKEEKPLQWAMAPPVIPTPYYCNRYMIQTHEVVPSCDVIVCEIQINSSSVTISSPVSGIFMSFVMCVLRAMIVLLVGFFS
ncbi:hypothetical protein CsSME_00025948 [Camellia sinensis var. sinensis]